MSSSSSEKTKRPKDGKADHVIVRNLFAFTIVRRLMALVIVAALATGMSLMAAWQIMRIKPAPQYIQLTEDGRIYPIAPLNVASISDGEILKFAVESVKWVNTYDYKSWKDQLQAQDNRFSPEGWNQYINELVKTDNLNTVTTKKVVVSATLIGEPRIEKQGVLPKLNVYAWLVTVPVRIEYASPGDTSLSSPEIAPQEGVVNMYIARVPLETSLRGYAIQVYQFDTTKHAP